MAPPKAAAKLAPVTVNTMAEAIAALDELEEISIRIEDDMRRQVDLKKAATAFSVKKKVDVIQLDGVYYRQVKRSNRFWVGERDEMPSPAPKGAKSLREICAGLTATVKGKQVPLWNYITKRVPDPEKIEKAVALGFITEAKISKAYIEKSQAPFLQRYVGEAKDE